VPPTGYDIQTHRNIARIAAALERIARVLENHAEVQARVDRVSGVAEKGSADAPETVRR
jgi:hypothetical protein